MRVTEEQLESVSKIREALVVLAWEFNSLVTSLQEEHDEQ